MREITFIELFCGIGGFRLGLEKTKNFKCIWANDNDKYASKIYRKNFGTKELIEGNIKTIDADSIPNHTLLTAGFPCQSFSVAGKRKGFQDTRGTLFFDIARITEAKKPELLLLENVKGLLNHDKGLTFQIILESLAELGYDVEWQVLNSKYFGVPQNRERVFIIGHLRGGGGGQIFPIGESTKVNTRKSETQIARTITSQYYKQGQWEQYIKERDRQTDRVYSENGVSPTLDSNTGGRHTPMVALRWVRTEKGKKARKKSMEKGRDYTPFNYGHRELVESKDNVSGCVTDAVNKDSLVGIKIIEDFYKNRPTRYFDESPTIREGRQGLKLTDGVKIRRLTPTECERLQGFPDGWTKGVSDTQRYKTLGNAVTVNVIEFLGKKLRECLV